MRKKIFILCMLLIGVLAGCAAHADDPAEGTGAAAGSGPEGTPEVAAVVGRTAMDVDLGDMNHIQLIGDTCYYVKYEKIPDSDQIARHLCRQEGEGPEEIIYTYAESTADFYLMCSRVDASGNWYNIYSRDAEGETAVYLEKLDRQGGLQYRMQMDQFAGALLEERIIDGAAGPRGEFCAVTFKGTVLWWDGQGEELRKTASGVEVPDMAETVGLVSAGEEGVYLYHSITGSSITFQKTDSGEESLGQKTVVELQPASGGGAARPSGSLYSGDLIQVYGTWGESCFLSDKGGLWRYSFRDGGLEYMFGWSDPYVSLERGQIEQISEDSGGLLLLRHDAALDSSARLRLDWRRQEELSGKTVITLGGDTNASDNLEAAAKRYNAQSDKYLVEVRTYDLTNYGKELDEMTLALLQGKGPDIFDFSFSPDISLGYYASKGILEDLDPYLAGSGIGLVGPVADALRVDGKLYTLGESFFLRGMVCQQGYSQDGGISIQQCREMADAYPEAYFKKNTGHSGMLDLLLAADMASYIDLQEGTCRFDSGEFAGLLDMVNSWKEPAFDNTSLYAVADELGRKEYLVEEVFFMGMADYLAVRNAARDFGAVTGYPNSRGEAMYQVCFQNLYGMNSASPNKEGAWDFLRYLISEENQKRISVHFPITEEGFSDALQNGFQATFSLFTGGMERGLVPTEQDMEEVQEIIRHIYYPDNQQSVISGIISEEAKAVFDGSKTSEQAAETIQNRVSLFLAE